MAEGLFADCAQPLFYYFLRKTGHPQEAEDLAADVLTAYLAAQRAGRSIDHPHAWVWRVARNRYAAWAQQRRRESPVPLEDEQAAQLAAPSEPLTDAIRAEELAALRREMAFIRREHRMLIVAHYIRGERLADIAAEWGVPIGTVKARLSRCRTKIREGMDMARNFGPRSYNPENMDFATSGNQPTGLPGSAMKRRLAVNILLEASENPSTIEELSMALGVAAPYMEDEVNALVQATLLKPVGERYVTDFYIMSFETASRLRRAMQEQVGMHAAPVKAIAADVLPLLREIAPDTAHQTASELRWWLLPWVYEVALFGEPRYISSWPERPCGPKETWGIVGYEQTSSPDWGFWFMGRIASSVRGGKAGMYRYDHPCEALWERVGEMDALQAELLLSLKREGRDLSTLTATERPIWQSMEGRYAHAAEGRPVLDVILLTAEGKQRLREAITGHPDFPALQVAVTAAFDRLMALLEPAMSPWTKAQQPYVASQELLNMRMIVLHACLADGTLTIPDKPEKSAIGIWLEMA